MTYVTKRCPHCNERLTFMEPKKIALGTPFKTCPRCRKTYIDKSYREIAVSGAPAIYRISPFKIIMFLFYLFGLIFILTSYSNDYFLPVCGVGLLLIIDVVLMIDDWKSYNEQKSFIALETLQSESRLSNPQYAAALKELGYPVPAKYLSPAKDAETVPEGYDYSGIPRFQKQETSFPDDDSPEDEEDVAAADPNTVHISPDIYARAIREKLDTDPYDPTYHKGACNPYTNTIITCEEDYIAYAGAFVYDRLTIGKRAAGHDKPQKKLPAYSEEMLSQLNDRFNRIDPVQAPKQDAPIPAQKTVSHTASRRRPTYRAPIPFWRNTRILARLALVLMALALPFSIVYAIFSQPSSSASPSPRPSFTSLPSESLSIQERLDRMKADGEAKEAQKNLPDPLSIPESGKILFEARYLDDRIAPLTIDASAQSSFIGFYVKLRYPRTKKTALTFFVQGGTTSEIDAPLGNYELLYASGYTYSWYGEELLFGPDTSYYLADELFDFYEEDGYVNGWTVTLDKQYDGNLDIDSIDAAEFDRD